MIKLKCNLHAYTCVRQYIYVCVCWHTSQQISTVLWRLRSSQFTWCRSSSKLFLDQSVAGSLDVSRSKVTIRGLRHPPPPPGSKWLPVAGGRSADLREGSWGRVGPMFGSMIHLALDPCVPDRRAGGRKEGRKEGKCEWGWEQNIKDAGVRLGSWRIKSENKGQKVTGQCGD